MNHSSMSKLSMLRGAVMLMNSEVQRWGKEFKV